MKEHYSTGETLTFENKVLRIYLETKLDLKQKLKHVNLPDCFEFFSEDPNWSYVNQNNPEDYDIKMYIHYDQFIEYDGYKLNITSDQITLSVSEYRGVIYGIQHLASLYTKLQLPISMIHNTPTLKQRGIIEGFYGIPWSHADRLDMIDFMREYKMNTYFYAPKDDIYHRKEWRKEYPKNAQENIIELIEKANDNYIDFVYCLSPGNDINPCNQDDIDILANKLLSVTKFGVSHFAILMDDINYELNSEEKRRFNTPGNMHSYIANQVYEQLHKELIDFRLTICPTEYFQNWDTPYRQDMRKTLNNEIDVFFTGYNTIAKTITNKDIEIVHDSFGHPLAIWDNYPTNDVNKDRLYLGPLCNRPTVFNNLVSCYLSNPMNQWQLSKPALITLADYMWDSYNYNEEASLKRAIKILSDEWEIDYESLELFIKLNQSTRLRTYVFDTLKDAIDNNLDTLKAYLNRLELCYNNMLSIREDVFKEVSRWHEKLGEEITYLKHFIQDKKTNVLPNDVNLGFNFGTYALTKGGFKNE